VPRVAPKNRPAAWWTNLSPAQRQYWRGYLHSALIGYVDAQGRRIPGLRELYRGFEPSDGFDIRHLDTWPATLKNRVRDAAGSLHLITNNPFKIVDARTQVRKRALIRFTGQAPTPDHAPKKFVVPLSSTAQTVHFVPDKKFGERAEIFQTTKGAKLRTRRYLFNEITGDQPQTFKQMIKVTGKLLADLPKEGNFLFLTTQGTIGALMYRDFILDEMRHYFEAYENPKTRIEDKKGFAGNLIGFEWHGDEDEAERIYINKEIRKAARSSRRRKERRRASNFQKWLRDQRATKRGRCPAKNRKSQRCTLKRGHRGRHKFKK
jgi:hypothetical protein